jgi:hypothetical protein
VPPAHDTVIVLEFPVYMAFGEALTETPFRAALTPRVEVGEVAEAPDLSVILTLSEYEPGVVDETVQVVLVEVHPDVTVTPDGTLQA